MRVCIQAQRSASPALSRFEVVERKGLGHPDTICDALVEELSTHLSRAYYAQFGVVLHHNVDKALLIGGEAHAGFGSGEWLAPIEIVLAGRATRSFRGVDIPVDAIAEACTRRWLAENLRHLDAARDVRIVPRIRPASRDLAELFARRPAAGAPLANDTSIGSGFAPLDALERAVLAAERALNAADVLSANPADGEDVKVMGVREERRTALTVARAFVGRFVPDYTAYVGHKRRVSEIARRAAAEASALECSVTVNAADGEDPGSLYLTVSGLSAEAGDDGQVGRGNRANGLITPCRPMSLEAVAGKNPVTHVGKLYNILAHRLAREIVAQIEVAEEAECLLVSCIGQPITAPQIVDIRVRCADEKALAARQPLIEELARGQLDALPSLWRESLERVPILW